MSGMAGFDRCHRKKLWVQSGYSQDVLVHNIGKMRVRWLFLSPLLAPFVLPPASAEVRANRKTLEIRLSARRHPPALTFDVQNLTKSRLRTTWQFPNIVGDNHRPGTIFLIDVRGTF
jgi:hypothetical protein